MNRDILKECKKLVARRRDLKIIHDMMEMSIKHGDLVFHYNPDLQIVTYGPVLKTVEWTAV